jgi:hypothetical protein
MIPPTITGYITRYLLEGPHAEKLALLEYSENELIGASDMATKEEINIEEIDPIDINKGLESLVETLTYYNQN